MVQYLLMGRQVLARLSLYKDPTLLLMEKNLYMEALKRMVDQTKIKEVLCKDHLNICLIALKSKNK
jgi:hypothetical protein